MTRGFRPGKEPPWLRKKQARERLGEGGAAQERLIDLFAGRTPRESRAMLRRWRIGLLAGAVVLAALAALLYGWSVVAALVAAVLAMVVLFLWWRLHRQKEQLEAMVDAVSGGKGRRRRGR